MSIGDGPSYSFWAKDSLSINNSPSCCATRKHRVKKI